MMGKDLHCRFGLLALAGTNLLLLSLLLPESAHGQRAQRGKRRDANGKRAERGPEGESSRENPIWLDPNREAPRRSHYHTFHSSVLGERVSCLVWLPFSYERVPETRFPVVYWLHGAQGDQRKCAEQFLPAYTEALKTRAAPPAIVVAVNGIPGSFYCDAVAGGCPIESVIIKDLIPSIDREFRTLATREGRLIEGFSMGGFGAARLGFKYPNVFGAVAINSAGPLGRDGGFPTPVRPALGDNEKELPLQLARRNADTLKTGTLIRIACGTEDSLLAGNTQLHQDLERLGIPHAFVEVRGVGHNPSDFYAKFGDRAFTLHRRAFGKRRTERARD